MALGNRRPSGGQREQRPNSGWLKENDRPQNNNSPHYRGLANVDGRDYWVSLWDKGKGLSLSFQRKDDERRSSYERGRDYQRPQENYRHDQPPTAPNTSRGYRDDREANPPGGWIRDEPPAEAYGADDFDR